METIGSAHHEPQDKDEIRALLLRDPYLHLYELGDLDPFFWPSTRWFAGQGEVALLYTAGGSSVLLCFTRAPEFGRSLLASIRNELPAQFYSHLSPGLFEALAPRYEARTFGALRKMSLRDDTGGWDPDGGVVPLGPSNLAEVVGFYARAYPDNWFDPRMLETRRYYAIRDASGGLVAVSGIHVYSPQEKVGVLGNVATLPAMRGRGLGTRVCRELCRVLRDEGMRIGLNVAQDNHAAIRCYESLGFVHEADYEERSLRERNGA